MPITSRCSLCGKLIDRDNAYVIIRNGKRKYYCSKEEFDGGEAYVQKRTEFESRIFDYIRYILGEGSFDIIIYTTELNKWLSGSNVETLCYFLSDKKEEYRMVISNKDIKNATSRLNYLSKMIINNIYNYTLIKKAEELNSKMSSKIQFDYTEYKPRLEPRKPVRRSLSDIEEDL